MEVSDPPRVTTIAVMGTILELLPRRPTSCGLRSEAIRSRRLLLPSSIGFITPAGYGMSGEQLISYSGC